MTKDRKRFYNPFASANFRRNPTLVERLEDVYVVMFGSVFLSVKQRTPRIKHIGIFDYLTLGIPYGLVALTRNQSHPILKTPIAALNMMLRFVMSSLFALVAIPLVTVVHGVMKCLKPSKPKTPLKQRVTFTQTHSPARMVQGLSLNVHAAIAGPDAMVRNQSYSFLYDSASAEGSNRNSRNPTPSDFLGMSVDEDSWMAPVHSSRPQQP